MAGRRIVGPEAEGLRMKAKAMRAIEGLLSQPTRPQERNIRRGLLAPPPLSAFRRIDPITMLAPEDWFLFDPEETTPHILWPLPHTAAMVDREDGTLVVQQHRAVTPKEVRGAVSRFGPYMVRSDFGQSQDGRFVTATAIYVFLGGRWANADGHKRRFHGHDAFSADDPLLGNDALQPALAIGIALRHRYEWAVAVGFPGTPTIRFSTDPTGMKEIFRLRDVPEHKDRREALMTWVTDHWRQDRHDPETEVYVRKHLRGTVRFDWRGMEVEILPAQFDIDQRDDLRAEREALRLAGADRRAATRAAP